MPELHFKGKEYVYNHHLSVPYRPLVPDQSKSVGDDSSNLIIHGDNLHALKALVPRFAGTVDCIFIDPPYNTGEENWNYNDNVNSPWMKDWLDGNPVNKEDMLRLPEVLDLILLRVPCNRDRRGIRIWMSSDHTPMTAEAAALMYLLLGIEEMD